MDTMGTGSDDSDDRGESKVLVKSEAREMLARQEGESRSYVHAHEVWANSADEKKRVTMSTTAFVNQRCAAVMVNSDECDVSWDEEARTFKVRLEGSCELSQRPYVQNLPDLIAHASSCPACNRTPLNLGDTDLSFKGEKYRLVANYGCWYCEASASWLRSFAGSVATILRGVFKGSVKVKVPGVELEVGTK